MHPGSLLRSRIVGDCFCRCTNKIFCGFFLVKFALDLRKGCRQVDQELCRHDHVKVAYMLLEGRMRYNNCKQKKYQSNPKVCPCIPNKYSKHYIASGRIYNCAQKYHVIAKYQNRRYIMAMRKR